MNKYLKALYQDDSLYFAYDVFFRANLFLSKDESNELFERILNDNLNINDVLTLWELSEENETTLFKLLTSNDRSSIKATVKGDIENKLELWFNAYPQEFVSEVKKKELQNRLLRTRGQTINKPKYHTTIFDEHIAKITTEEAQSLEGMIFKLAVQSTDIIYTSTPKLLYNVKHRTECVIFSTMAHLLTIESFFSNAYGKVVTDVLFKLHELISRAYYFIFDEYLPYRPDEKYHFTLHGREINARFHFYGKELSTLPKRKDTPPLKLLTLIYDKPFDTRLDINPYIECIDDHNKITQFGHIIRYLKHFANPLMVLMENSKKE